MAPLYERDVRELIDSTRSFYAALRRRDVDELEYSKFQCQYMQTNENPA
jgi:hypothetical protein